MTCESLLVLPHNLIPELEDLPLSASKTDMATIVKVMQLPDSGLEIRDRMWLKITIANAVIGEKCRAVWAPAQLKTKLSFALIKIWSFFKVNYCK